MHGFGIFRILENYGMCLSKLKIKTIQFYFIKPSSLLVETSLLGRLPALPKMSQNWQTLA
jgi:hypothetical protein